MSNNKKALGKGLSALISDSTISFMKNDQINAQVMKDGILPSDKVIELSINNLEPNIDQPRKSIHEESLKELTNSISKHGILQPILVKRNGEHRFQIIAGERRWHAAKMANFATVPVIIKDADEKTLFEIAIVENIQRENLKPLEEAEAYSKLMKIFGYTQENLSLRLGKSRSHIANILRLLKLPKEIKIMIDEDKISMGHAKAIMNSREPIALAKQVIEKKLSVRATEELTKIKEVKKTQLSQEIQNDFLIKEIEKIIKNVTNDYDMQQIEDKIKMKLSMNTKIITEGDSSYIIIKADGIYDLDKFLSILSATS